MNRRVFLFGLPTAALSAFGDAKIIEPRWLEETRKTVVTGRNLRRPLRVAHIAGFHASALIPISFLEEAFRRVLAMKPDLGWFPNHFYVQEMVTRGGVRVLHNDAAKLVIDGPPIVPVIDTRYAVGLHAYQNRWIHTTRGVENIIGIRVNCRPELSLLLVS